MHSEMTGRCAHFCRLPCSEYTEPQILPEYYEFIISALLHTAMNVDCVLNVEWAYAKGECIKKAKFVKKNVKTTLLKSAWLT